MRPQLIIQTNGKMVGLSTGADACTEHEMGSAPMMGQLCHQAEADQQAISALKAGVKLLSLVDGNRTPDPKTTFPSVIAAKRITKTPPDLKFEKTDAPFPEAILALSRNSDLWNNRELQFSGAYQANHAGNICGAWDHREFAIRVRGADLVKSLEGFFQAMTAGNVAFAGRLLRCADRFDRMSGVILADLMRLNQQERGCLGQAQADYESSLRLKALDDSAKLMAEIRDIADTSKKPINYPGHIWAKWLNEAEGTIAYGLNPGFGVPAAYLGPYSRQELLAWARAGFSYHLMPGSLDTPAQQKPAPRQKASSAPS